jgi:hypothetical protein
MVFGLDALLSGSEVVWRRRASSAEFGRTLRSAEQALVTAIDCALELARVPAGVVVLLHQDDGVWSDQAFPEIAVPEATEAAEDPRWWLPAEWPSVELAPDDELEITEALGRLDAFGVPRGDEAAVFLRVVAQRVRALGRQRRGADFKIIVTTHDPPDILDDVRRAG